MATVASAISFNSGYRKKTADSALSLCNHCTKGPALFALCGPFSLVPPTERKNRTSRLTINQLAFPVNLFLSDALFFLEFPCAYGQFEEQDYTVYPHFRNIHFFGTDQPSLAADITQQRFCRIFYHAGADYWRCYFSVFMDKKMSAFRRTRKLYTAQASYSPNNMNSQNKKLARILLGDSHGNIKYSVGCDGPTINAMRTKTALIFNKKNQNNKSCFYKERENHHEENIFCSFRLNDDNFDGK